MFCRHWEPAGYVDLGNRLSEEREVVDRFGEDAALAGGCAHPEPVRAGASSKASCPLWAAIEPHD